MPLPNRGGWFPSPASEASSAEGGGYLLSLFVTPLLQNVRTLAPAGLARGVPPRAGAGRERVIALAHLHRLALSLERGAPAHLPRLRELVRRNPGALVTPQAR